MTKEKKLIYEIIIIVLCAFIITGTLIVRSNLQRNKLQKEIHEVVNQDINTGNFNTKIKCNGNFGVVEKAIKTYLNDYSTKFNEVNSIMNDTKLLNLLSVDNYKKDAPEFKESLKYLEDQKNIYEKDIDFLINNSDEEYINNYIYKYTKDKYFVKLYKKLVKEENIYNKTTKYKDELTNHKKKVETTFEYTKNIFEFLKVNKGKWKIDGDKIKFDNNDLLTKYNGALNKIKNK